MKVLLQTSSATMWALYSLANNPEAQEKLYEETKRVLPNNETITPEKLPELQYVRAVMKETFRHVIYMFIHTHFSQNLLSRELRISSCNFIVVVSI